MNLINLEISSSSYATSSNSLIYPSEKALAKTKYCANLDLRLILSPSGDTNSILPLHYPITLNRASTFLTFANFTTLTSFF